MNWYLAVLRNYATFDGRARRKEFWMFHLVDFLISAVLFILVLLVSATQGEGPLVPVGVLLLILFGAYQLAVLVPSWALRVRRMHDLGRSGWYLLLGLIPFVGGIILLVMFCTEGIHGPNGYGYDPKHAAPVPHYA